MTSKEKAIQIGKSSVSPEKKPATPDAQRILYKYSNKISELLFENANEFISLISPDGKFIYINPFFNNLGHRISDLINHSIINYIHPDDAGAILDLFTECKKENMNTALYDKCRTIRYRFNSKSGNWVKIESDINILTDNSNLSAFLFISREVTDSGTNSNKPTPEAVKIQKKIKEEIVFRKKIEDQLNKSEERFRDISYGIADIIWEMDSNGIYTYCSENVKNIYGYTAKEIIGNSPGMLLKSDLVKKWEEIFKKKIKNKKPYKDINSIVITKDGTSMHILSNGFPILNKEGEVIGCRGVDKDITKRKIDEEVNILLAAFARESPHPILSSGYDGNIIYKNPAALNILEGLGLDSPYNFLPGNHIDLINSCLKDGKNYNNLEVRIKGHVFSWTYNPIPGINVIHLHGLDITDQKYFEEKLLHDSLHDKLTGLPNRSLFNDELLRAIKISKRRDDYHFAVLFLDLGRFKNINDSLGHIVGDKVLVEVSGRISSCLRPEDTASRFGGDEFTVLLNNITDSSDPVRVAERIQKKISMPLNIEGNEIFPSASIGIVISSQEYSQPEDLLRDANTAMYRAKAEGISGHAIFDKTMHKQAVKLLQLESNLQYAFERKEYALYYQPIISFESGKIVGFEALLRWQHPKRGMILPEEFMPILEETGQIIPVGAWVIEKACSQLRSWHKKYPKKQHLFISVNISAKQFSQPDLIKIITKILENENLYPGYLNLEVTEGIIMHNQKKTTSMLSELREMDVQIDIDDFGIGYSSLNHLHNCPIHALKIDRSFIAAMNGNAWSSVIPNTIITLAKHLEMDVIAEGVESARQFKQLKKLDCGYAQGNFFSPPVDSKKAGALLLSNPKWK